MLYIVRCIPSSSSSLTKYRGSNPCERNRGSIRVSARRKDDLDFAEKLYSFLFGKKALEDPSPFGLKRIPEDRKKMNLYPATTTEFAAPIESDNAEMAAFRSLLAQTLLEKSDLRLAFDASVHGWNYSAFHKCVDGFGSAIVLAKAEDGSIFGGYNPKGWIGLGENRDSNAAFLFTWRDGDTTNIDGVIKLRKVGGPSLAVIDKESFGIQFGAEGLTIGLVPGDDPKKAKSRLGTYYERCPDGGRTLFAGSEMIVMLDELKVYVAKGKGEEWELDGIVWKTKWKE